MGRTNTGKYKYIEIVTNADVCHYRQKVLNNQEAIDKKVEKVKAKIKRSGKKGYKVKVMSGGFHAKTCFDAFNK